MALMNKPKPRSSSEQVHERGTWKRRLVRKKLLKRTQNKSDLSAGFAFFSPAKVQKSSVKLMQPVLCRLGFLGVVLRSISAADVPSGGSPFGRCRRTSASFTAKSKTIRCYQMGLGLERDELRAEDVPKLACWAFDPAYPVSERFCF